MVLLLRVMKMGLKAPTLLKRLRFAWVLQPDAYTNLKPKEPEMTLLETLRAVERFDGGLNPMCVICELNPTWHGHDPHCDLAAAITTVEKLEAFADTFEAEQVTKSTEARTLRTLLS